MNRQSGTKSSSQLLLRQQVMPGEPPENPQNLNRLKIHPANVVCLAYSRNRLWFRQYIGAELLFPPTLLALEKEKSCKKFTNNMLPIFQDITNYLSCS
jgi:hypothetical protein